MTKGSFYHHFANANVFVAALLEFWETTYEQAIRLVQADYETDPVRTMELLLPRFLAVPHEAEGALRAWGHTNPMVGAVVRRQKQRWVECVADAHTAMIEDPQRRSLMAWMFVSMMIGMQLGERPIDRTRMAAAIVEFMRQHLGIRVEYDLRATTAAPDAARARSARTARRGR